MVLMALIMLFGSSPGLKCIVVTLKALVNYYRFILSHILSPLSPYFVPFPSYFGTLRGHFGTLVLYTRLVDNHVKGNLSELVVKSFAIRQGTYEKSRDRKRAKEHSAELKELSEKMARTSSKIAPEKWKNQP